MLQYQKEKCTEYPNGGTQAKLPQERPYVWCAAFEENVCQNIKQEEFRRNIHGCELLDEQIGGPQGYGLVKWRPLVVLRSSGSL